MLAQCERGASLSMFQSARLATARRARPADFARSVRRGRGKMLPLALSDAEIGDVLAHLRSLRNPPP